MTMEWGTFSPKALDFIYNSNARINIASGSVSSSKTINCVVRWIKYLISGPKGTLCMAGKTRGTLKRNVLDPMRDTVGDKNYEWIDKQEGTLRVFDRTIHCFGAHDESSEGKIRGATFAGANCDELTLFPKSFFDQLMARLRVKGAQCFATTNPDSPYHWLKKDYIDNPRITNKKIWNFTMEDNPNLDEEYKRDIESMYSGLWHKRMVNGLWVQAEGSIYDMFRDTHIVRDIPEKYTLECVGVDYGITNPMAFIKVGFAEDKYSVQKEFYYDSNESGRQKIDGEYADDLLKFIDGNKEIVVVVDPSATSFIVELGRRGVYVVKANNAVLDGIRYVSQLLTANRLFVKNGNCPNLVKEFYSYVWDPNAQKRGEDKPLKLNDHVLDALRYVLMYMATREGTSVIECVPSEGRSSYDGADRESRYDRSAGEDW